MLPYIFLEAPCNYALKNNILSVGLILYISIYYHKISRAALMVTSTLEINNSVCLNPGKEADTVLQDFLTHFDGAELQMFCGFKEEAHYFFFFFLDIEDPKVKSSHRLPDSINCVVIGHYQSSVLAIHTHISVHIPNGSQLTNLRIVCRLQ